MSCRNNKMTIFRYKEVKTWQINYKYDYTNPALFFNVKMFIQTKIVDRNSNNHNHINFFFNNAILSIKLNWYTYRSIWIDID